MGHHRHTFTSPRAILRIERILRLLRSERLTAEQTAQKLHAALSGTHRYIAHLHASPKRIYICGYDTSGFRPVAIFAAGDCEDAPKPPRKTKQQVWQEIKSDPVKLARVHETQERTRNKRRGGPPPKRPTIYDPPLEQQITAIVESWPGIMTKQIAARIGAGERAVKNALTRMKKNGIVTYKRRTIEGAMWESTARKVVKHEPVVTKRQSIFSALGV